MSNDIKITVSGNDAQMFAVWQRQQAEILKNQAALVKLGEAGMRAGEQTGKAMQGAGKDAGFLTTALTGVTSSVGALGAALGLIIKQFSELAQKQKDAARAQLTEAE